MFEVILFYLIKEGLLKCSRYLLGPFLTQFWLYLVQMVIPIYSYLAFENMNFGFSGYVLPSIVKPGIFAMFYFSFSSRIDSIAKFKDPLEKFASVTYRHIRKKKQHSMRIRKTTKYIKVRGNKETYSIKHYSPMIKCDNCILQAHICLSSSIDAIQLEIRLVKKTEWQKYRINKHFRM